MMADLKDSEKIQKSMKFRMKQEIEPVIKNIKEREEKILSVQDSILKKIMTKKQNIDKYKMESTQAAEKFKAFFDRKAKTEQLINTIDKEKAELEKELQSLIAKAQSFNLSIKSSDVKNYVKELQKSLKNIEEKKSGFSKRLGELTDVISKKD